MCQILKYLTHFSSTYLAHIVDVFTAASGSVGFYVLVLTAPGRGFNLRQPLGPSGAYQERHPSSFPGHCVAVAGQRHWHAGQESVLGASEDVVAVREAHPQGHRPHVPRARVFQRPGQPGPGSPVQCDEGEELMTLDVFVDWTAVVCDLLHRTVWCLIKGCKMCVFYSLGLIVLWTLTMVFWKEQRQLSKQL